MPRSPDQLIPMDVPDDAVRFDADAFSELVWNHGVKFIHWRALRCPVGLVDEDDIRRPHEHHENCSNGFIYVCAGEITCAFIGNSKDVSYQDTGRKDGSTVTIILPPVYDDTDEEIDFTYFDRMYLKVNNITVPTFQTFTTNETGVNKMRFPVVSVSDLIDARGTRYKEGVDFCVTADGKIQWMGAGPGINPSLNVGIVCSIRYRYQPFYYVKNLIHEVRVVRTEDDLGQSSVVRMPQLAVLQREWIFLNEQNDPDAPKTKLDKKELGPDFGDR